MILFYVDKRTKHNYNRIIKTIHTMFSRLSRELITPPALVFVFCGSVSHTQYITFQSICWSVLVIELFASGVSLGFSHLI